MADLRPTAPSDPSRAQLILITGFVLAITFVMVAVLLNTAIFTENLATRSGSAQTSHAITLTADIAAGGEALVQYGNRYNTSSYSALTENLQRGVGQTETLLQRQQLTDGVVLQIALQSTDRAVWVNQTYAPGNFTDGSGARTWDLTADSLDGARAVRFNITDPAQLADTNASDPETEPFTLVAFDDADTNWSMAVYHDEAGLSDATGTTPYVVEVTDGNENTRFCSASSPRSHLSVNVSAGTFAGSDCRALQFGENLSTVRNIRFTNGHHAYGTYRLLANNETAVDQTIYNETGAQPPITTPALYGASLTVTYESRTLTFETTTAVEPEEADAAD